MLAAGLLMEVGSNAVNKRQAKGLPFKMVVDEGGSLCAMRRTKNSL